MPCADLAAITTVIGPRERRCEECVKIAEPIRRVLVLFNRRLTELESQLKTASVKKQPNE